MSKDTVAGLEIVAGGLAVSFLFCSLANLLGHAEPSLKVSFVFASLGFLLWAGSGVLGVLADDLSEGQTTSD